MNQLKSKGRGWRVITHSYIQDININTIFKEEIIYQDSTHLKEEGKKPNFFQRFENIQKYYFCIKIEIYSKFHKVLL